MDTAAHWYAAEAITWIAYGEARLLTPEDEEAPEVLAAQRYLVAEVEAGRLQPEGILCDSCNRFKGDAVSEAIPPRVFATRDSCSTDRHEGNLARTITLDSRVAPPLVDGQIAMDDILRPRGPFYRDVRFLAAEVQALQPLIAHVQALPQDKEIGRQPTLKASPQKAKPVVKPVYSESACRGWFMIRVSQWPNGEQAPTAPTCLAAARQHFSGSIARDRFREIRRKCVPKEWLKSGPRGPRG